MSTDWHALSVRQPYAHLIVHGVKKFEARTWEPATFGVVAIHASKSFAIGWKQDSAVLSALQRLGLSVEDAANFSRSAIIGAVTVTGVIQPDDSAHARLPKIQRDLCSDDGYTEGLCLWRLAKPVRVHPIPCDGKLWLWPIPSAAARALDRAVG